MHFKSPKRANKMHRLKCIVIIITRDYKCIFVSAIFYTENNLSKVVRATVVKVVKKINGSYLVAILEALFAH